MNQAAKDALSGSMVAADQAHHGPFRWADVESARRAVRAPGKGRGEACDAIRPREQHGPVGSPPMGPRTLLPAADSTLSRELLRALVCLAAVVALAILATVLEPRGATLGLP